MRHSIPEIMNEQPFENAIYTTQHLGLGFEISKRGELYMISQGSGGGYGDLLERDPALVIMDIEESLISPDWAKKLYKVVFDEKTLAVDEAATKKMRDEYREQRKKQGVPYAEFVKKHVRDIPPDDVPFYGSWNGNNEQVYCGSNDDLRDANNPGANYMINPKDVRIGELEKELEVVRKKAGIVATNNRT